MRSSIGASALAALGVVFFGCPAHHDPGPMVGVTPVGSSSGAKGKTGDNVFRCTSDAECRSSVYYCGGCKCLPLADQEPDPQCLGGDSMKCPIDPCRGQSAFCDNGRCNLRAATSP